MSDLVTAEQAELLISQDKDLADLLEDKLQIKYKMKQTERPPLPFPLYMYGLLSLVQGNTVIVRGQPPLAPIKRDVTQDFAKIILHDNKSFLARLELEQRLQTPDENDRLVKFIITKSNIGCVEESLVFRPISEVKEHFLRAHFPEVDLAKCIGPNVYLLQFVFAMRGRHIHAENLFVPTDFGEFNSKLEAERQMMRNGKTIRFTFLLRYYGEAARIVEAFDTMQEDWWSEWFPGAPTIRAGVMANTPRSNHPAPSSYRLLTPMITFPDLATYATMFASAVSAEQKRMDRACDSMDIEFRLAINPRITDQRQLFMAVPYQESVSYAEPLLIKFNDADEDEHPWAAQPFDTHMLPIKYMYFSLRRPFYKDVEAFDDRKFDNLPTLPKADTPIDVNQFIESMSKFNAQVTRKPQTEHTKHLFTALRNLFDNGYTLALRNFTMMLLGNIPSELPLFDLFQGLTQQEIEKGVATFLPFLTPSQQLALDPHTTGGFRRAPSSNVFITGPPGTGKSRLVTALAVLLNNFPKDAYQEAVKKGEKWDEKEQGSMYRTVVYMAPTNNLCDDFCANIDSLATPHAMGREIMVTRCHPFQVEEQVWQNETGQDAEYVDVFTDANADTAALAEAFKYFAPMIADMQNADKFEFGVRARQLRLPKRSLGYNMLIVAGEVPESEHMARFTNPTKHAQWKSIFHNLKRGRPWPEGDEETAFTSATNKLRDEAIAMSDYLVLVPHQVGVPKFRRKINADFGIIDEAPKMREADVVMAQVMVVCRFWASCGDLMQGGTFYIPDGQSHFGAQLSMSMFKRLSLAGFPTITLNHQLRMVPRIADFVSGLSYNSQLITSDKLKTSEMNIKALNTMEKISGLRDNIVWLHVEGTCTRLQSMASKFNERELEYTVDVANSLLKDGYAPKDITIMCPYRAQVQITERALRFLKNQTPDLANIAVLTFDTFEGRQSQAIIVPFVVDDRIGFLEKNSRINVAISRSQASLCFIGNAGAISQTNHTKSLLYKVLQWCRKEKLVVNTNDWNLEPDITDFLRSHIFSEDATTGKAEKY